MKKTKAYLLFTENIDKAHAEIAEIGGHIIHKFTDSVFVANLPDSKTKGNLKYCSTEPLAKLDDVSALMVEAWKGFESKQQRQLKEEKSIQWDTLGYQNPKNPDNDAQLKAEFEAIKKNIESTGTPTSEKMVGSIAVGLIIVSGTASGLGFSDAENSLVVQEVMEGCHFLATAGATPANITFVYVIHIVPPINTVPNPACDSYEGCESVFRDPALLELGYPTGYQGCVDFVNDLRINNKTDWAYMAFITKYPMFWFAYASGVRICMAYANDGWGPNAINQVFAHETCHIFGAADEYASSGCTCANSGINNVPNYNCANCQSPFGKVPCLMTGNTLVLCEYSKGQIGWSYWYGDVQVPNTGIAGDPSAVMFNNQIYCFHQGNANNGLWYNIFDGTNWLGDVQVPNTGIAGDPSAVMFNNQIYCFHQGNANNGLWYNIFDGTNWLGDVQVPNTGIAGDPSAVMFNNQIYCFHQGNANNGLWYNIFDGTNWLGDVQVPNTGIAGDPSAVMFNNQIYCFHQGNANNGLWYNIFDGTNWLGDVQVPNTGIAGDPSAVMFNNQIYCFHQGNANNGLWYNIFDGTNWLGDVQVPNTGIAGDPSAVMFNNQIYCFHQGNGNNGLWYNIFILK